jgi:hypothetical protein
MRQFIPVLFSSLLWFSCEQQNKISTDQVEKISSIQLAHNFSDIQEMDSEVRLLGIDGSAENVALWKNLIRFHTDLYATNDSIDNGNADNARDIARRFLYTWFKKDSTKTIRVPVDIDDTTPKAIVKLALAMAEESYIIWTRKNYNTKGGYFDGESARIVFFTDKTLLKKGEKLSGYVTFAAIANMKNIDMLVDEVQVNGQVINHDQYGWKFDFVPAIDKTGLVTFDLRAEVKTKARMWFVETQSVYIQN